jgi:hypothetical protein
MEHALGRPAREAAPAPERGSRLCAGDWVRVRSREEILATLDASGCLDGMPDYLNATTRLPPYDPRQYIEDLRSRNVDLGTLLHGAVYRVGAFLVRRGERLGRGAAFAKVLMAWYDASNRTRGLYFDAEHVPYCDKEFIVRSLVHRIVDERTGYMLHFKSPSIILEHVVCQGTGSDNRMFCPRAHLSPLAPDLADAHGPAARPGRPGAAGRPAGSAAVLTGAHGRAAGHSASAARVKRGGNAMGIRGFPGRRGV